MSRQPARQGAPVYSNLTPSSDPASPATSPTYPRNNNPLQGTSPLNPTRQQQGYYDAPRSGSGGRYYPDDSPRESGSSNSAGSSIDNRGLGTTEGVATGAIGSGYGPYSYEPVSNNGGSGGVPRSGSSGGAQRYSTRISPVPGAFSSAPPSTTSHNSRAPLTGAKGVPRVAPVWTAKDAALDDKLHDVDDARYPDRIICTAFSARGWLNMGALLLLVGGLITLFAGYPIIQYYSTQTMSTFGAYGIGGVNSSGQVPFIPGLPTLIDSATPSSALTRTGFDGKKYVLAFSDEFETAGRTFWPGDDPFWEAVDLHYWATGDFEWYDPDAITTANGKLEITVTEEPLHGLSFRSGMLQSWNKFCFTGGYIEVSIQLPGSDTVSGFWPGAWTMGNLGRAGYGATTDGTWPYSYNSCDVGTLKNQTNPAGTAPAAALNTGSSDYGGELSYQPGQRLSACTCPGGDHPGPNTKVGRGSPEIDIIEAQISYHNAGFHGSVSQSAQFAPYDDSYQSITTAPATVIYDAVKTYLNGYLGGIYQQAVSAVTYTNPVAYELGGAQFSKYGWEAWPDPTNGFITWSVGETASWTMTAAAIGPNANVGVGQRLISQEPMYIILNLGISSSFQTVAWGDLIFPAKMLVDYVRVYQREDSPNIGCDPPGMPTADYIANHINAYTNPNLTTWDAAGYTYPSNSLTTKC